MVAEHITNIPCDKHSGRRTHTLMLIVHSIESPLANGFAVSMAHNWLGRRYDNNGRLIEASSNVIVSPDTLVRSVHTDYAAWHASWANSLSVGYEQAGYAAFSREDWLTPGGRDQIDRLAREMAQDALQYGIPLRWLTAAEVNAIANGDRTIKGLVTHAVIDPGNRTDPGDQYPYDVLLDSIKHYASTNTTSQEDDMPLTKADVDLILDTPIERSIGGNITLRTFLKYSDGNFDSIRDKVKDINTAKGPVSLRQFVANGTKAAQEAAANTGPIWRGGKWVSLRQEIANVLTKLLGLEPLIVEAHKVATAPDVDAPAGAPE